MDVCGTVLTPHLVPDTSLNNRIAPRLVPAPGKTRLDTTQKGYQRMMKLEDIIILAQMKCGKARMN